MKVRLAALTIGLAIALNLSGIIAPANVIALAGTPVETPSIEPTASPEQHKSFFTLGREALDFSKFAQRSQVRQRRDPYQIVTEVRQRHKAAAQDISVTEAIQQLKEQLPEQSHQLRNKVSELPSKIKTSAGQATASLRSSVDTVSKNYSQKTKLPSLPAEIKDRIYGIQQSIKETAIKLLEDTSYQINRAAQHLRI